MLFTQQALPIFISFAVTWGPNLGPCCKSVILASAIKISIKFVYAFLPKRHFPCSPPPHHLLFWGGEALPTPSPQHNANALIYGSLFQRHCVSAIPSIRKPRFYQFVQDTPYPNFDFITKSRNFAIPSIRKPRFTDGGGGIPMDPHESLWILMGLYGSL